MFFLFNAAVESISGFIALLPIMVLFHIIILKKDKKYNLRALIPHMIAVYIFCFVLLFVLSVTGVPNAYSFRAYININLIPFTDIFTNSVQYIQNLILFIPLGFLLPMLWEKFEKKWLAFITGLLFSLTIEIIQIFSYRATDIDDLLMNTLGAVAGWFLFALVKRIFPQISIFLSNKEAKYWNLELCFAFSLAWGIMLFIQPFISGWLWSLFIGSRTP